jgi:dihydropteroate synthase-like protein
MAYPAVKELAGDKADVLMLGVDIAAFATPRLLERAYSGEYDLVLVSGLVASDFSGLERKLGVKIRLGPRNAFDIPMALACAGKVEFSSKVYLLELLAGVKREDAVRELGEIEKNAPFAFSLNGVKFGGGSVMKVVGEIGDATGLSDAGLAKRIEGLGMADVIDLGIPLESSEDAVRRVVRTARRVTSKPISVDTLVPEYIKAGVGEGASMVMSLSDANLEESGPAVARRGAAAVVIPDGESLDSLYANITKARKMGIEKILADPILPPVGYGFVEAVARCHEFRRREPGVPLFFGAGNVTEQMDADSIGANALLAGMAMELGASALFTTEAGHKTTGSVSELKTACMMMALARKRKSAPKDLGIDLLVIKEKRERKGLVGPSTVVRAKRHQWKLDPAGSFNIFVEDNMIYARNGDVTVVGEDAQSIIDTLSDMGLVSMLDHAGYLGRELEKAELEIRFRRSYLQDDKF